MKDNDMFERFQRRANKIERLAMVGAVIGGLVWLAVVGGVVWLAYVLLQHFNII